MQIRRTFLLSLVLGISSIGNVFAHSTGPDPGVNGIFGATLTCAQSGCHTGNPVNASPGSVTVSGLPGTWVPGQTYPLTITVQRTNIRTFGFQLSSVSDANNLQAGTLTSTSGEKVICGSSGGFLINCGVTSAIQFAEHSFPSSTGVFTTTWTAPSSTSAGIVRFNVAGNAANGDGNNTGDFIYTNVYKVSPAAAVDLSTHAFTMVDRGGVSVITDGSGAQTAGYSLIQPASGSTTPAGVAIFGFRKSNILVGETGVPATPALTSGRIYAEIAGPVDTGLAIANPNSSDATINFFFTDASGNPAGSGSTTILANHQIAQFLDQFPFNVYPTPTFQGTFSFSSNVQVAVVALKGFLNERSDFLTSTLPVIDTTLPSNNGTVVLPHFADGGGWTTAILLVNPADSPMSGTIQFRDQNGVAAPLTANGTTNSSFSYTVNGRSSFKLLTSGAGAATASGSVTVTPAAGNSTPVPLVVFSNKPGAFTVAQAGASANSGTAFRTYVEASGTLGQTGSISTGIAVANASPTAGTIMFDLYDSTGAFIGHQTSPIAGSGQLVTFINQIFPALGVPFKGVLRISTTTSAISVVSLRGRYNERSPTSDFLITTTPPTNENGTPSGTELLFPHLVNGGDVVNGVYTTQFIVFSGTLGQATSGNLKFLKPDGTPFDLTVN